MIIGFKCPLDISFKGKKDHSFDECIYECDHKCVDIGILCAITHHLVNNFHYKRRLISVTSLTGCMRESYLSSKYDVYVTPKNLWYTTRGSIIHGILEPIYGKGKGIFAGLKNRFLLEKRLYTTLKNKVRLSGQIDRYDTITRELTDYKTIGDLGLGKLTAPKKDHVVQTNIYKYLLNKNGYDVESIKIVYVSLMDSVETGKVNYISKYNNLIEFPVEKVDLYSNEDIESFLLAKTTILNNAYTKNILPPIPDEDTRSWNCGDSRSGKGYCKFRTVCPYWMEKWGDKVQIESPVEKFIKEK